jgi:23S rRNA (guanosine2251-2'-O)-methyltransferase
MPQRKPFRPHKNRSRSRFQSGAEDERSTGHSAARPGGHSKGHPKTHREGSRGAHSGEHRGERPERIAERPKGGPRNARDNARRSAERREKQQDHAVTGAGSNLKPISQEAAESKPFLKGPKGTYWIYGNHAVLAAIDNPARRIRRLVQTDPSGERAARGGSDRQLPSWETLARPELDRLAGRESVHQGVAAQVEPLPETEIEDLIASVGDRADCVLLVLDQVTDPHNVGAILRSAAAFGAIGVVLTERHAAPESGTLAKAASGALEVVPVVRVGNLARAMEQLKEANFWCAGLAAEGQKTLAEARLSGRVAICLGAEGAGLRRLTRVHCDLLVKLPTRGPIDHLNVSNAAAVALYELARANH